MEHEVFVPVSAQALREVLRDPARVARCVPGLQQDVGGAPVSGRLKVRVDGHTITYRGTLHLAEQDGGFAVECEGTEVRGTGSVKVTLTLRLTPADHGTELAFKGTAQAEGRLADFSPTSTLTAAHRLLNRCSEALAAEAGGTPAEGRSTGEGGPYEADSGAPGADEPDADGALGADASDTAADSRLDDDALFEGDEPVSPLAPPADDELDLPAEAAHARRTMIGRSAEEVDHAPPRGRYAPVPAPATASAKAALRWAAPAAALAVASAVVLGRALRRRK
ncbi:SRPBCC domain-containing protein [Streptomyces sannanensis]|uniref:SRPBCC domain-containing protein n=1 Tax=Streptomyces sannanensis TaxID=285536 RepID=A0ABP6SD57_9ACTN